MNNTENEKLGAFLKQERKKKKLSVEEMANKLKITPENIRYIESGNMRPIGLDDIFLKSHIKSYLSEVSLEPDEILREFSVFEDKNTSKINPEVPPSIFYNIYIQIIALIIFIAFIFLGINLLTHSNNIINLNHKTIDNPLNTQVPNIDNEE